tara:strand:+ start:1276 stop:2244 length:969 start_codon:yes stop_codon:yes gene_type:complete
MTYRKLKLLNTEPSRLSENSRNKLSKFTFLDEYEADKNYLIKNIDKYEALLIGLRLKIDTNILKKAKNLKYIISPTTGLNHIDIEYALIKGIKIISLKDEIEFLENITATAELTWGLILSLVRKINEANKSVINNKWNRDLFKGLELKGLTLGIIGYGRLGSMVAKYGDAFDMKVVVNDIKTNIISKYKQITTDELLRISDIISLHIPSNKNNINFLNKNKLSKIKKGSIFINTSRGDIVDEDFLYELLKSNHLAGLGLDVLSDEFSGKKDWLEKNKLKKFAEKNENVIITPHIGGLTHQSVEKANNFIIDKFKNFVKDKTI